MDNHLHRTKRKIVAIETTAAKIVKKQFGCSLGRPCRCLCSSWPPRWGQGVALGHGSGMAAERSKGSARVRRSPRWVQDCPLSGTKDLQRSGGRPVGVSAHHVAPMGSGLPAERSEGLQLLIGSPVVVSAHRGRPDGVKVLPLAMVQDCPLSGAKDLQRSGGRPWPPRWGQGVALGHGSGLPAERSKGSARVRRSPVAASMGSRCCPWSWVRNGR